MNNTAGNLAANIRKLREERGLTQQRIAELSSIPRPTWASLESGDANPTLNVLNRAAAALQVSIEELIAAPREQVQFFRAGFGKERRREGGSLRPLIPETIPGLEISRIELKAGGQITGVPHTRGTREYLTCEKGRIELTAAGQTHCLQAGDSLVFRGDQRHSYRNPDRNKACVAMSVVCITT